jgi:Ala-tRNA(Pro) deacylase
VREPAHSPIVHNEISEEEFIMPIEKLKKFLDDNNVEYVVMSHSPAYTAQRAAASAHISGKEMAKTVMVKVNEKMAMAVLPASFRVDFNKLKEATGAKSVELASESDFRNMFPDCDVGAMPPFGNLYGMDVYVAEKLAENEQIVFNACSHRDLIRLAFADYERLVKPKIVKIVYS